MWLKGRQKKKGQEKDNNSRFYADPESQHIWRVAKKRTTCAFTLIRKVNTFDGSPKKKDKKKTTTRAFIFVDRLRWSRKSMWLKGRQKKGQEKDNNSRFYADPESQHVRQVIKKKDKKKTTTQSLQHGHSKSLESLKDYHLIQEVSGWLDTEFRSWTTPRMDC